jgi:isochorismate pyruvate lyase
MRRLETRMATLVILENRYLFSHSIEEVRTQIDRIDRQIVALIGERGNYVKQAAKFKKTTDDVKAPQRVEQVIAKVTSLSREFGANPSVTEQVYRAMISAFIAAELAEHAALQNDAPASVTRQDLPTEAARASWTRHSGG